MRRSRWIGLLVGVTALAPGGAGQAQAPPAPGAVPGLLGVPTAPEPIGGEAGKLLRPRVGLLGLEFLERAIASGVARRAEAAATTAAEREVAGFARRYGIGVDLARRIRDAAVAEGLDPELAFRLVRVESRFKVRARGPAGALGLTQLMPSTARAVDRSLRSEEQILDPANNLRVGFRYLRRMIERYDDVRLGLLAYNRGTGTVNRYLRQGRDPENGYSRKVLGGRGGEYRGSGLLGG